MRMVYIHSYSNLEIAPPSVVRPEAKESEEVGSCNPADVDRGSRADEERVGYVRGWLQR